MKSILHALLLLPLLGTTLACDFPWDPYYLWTDPEVNARFTQLQPEDLREVRLSSDRGGSFNVHIPKDKWKEVLELLSSMPAMETIGSGNWDSHLFLNIETEMGWYEISLSTRPNLGSRIVAIVDGGRDPEEFLSFHDGEAIWEWLTVTPGIFDDDRPNHSFQADPSPRGRGHGPLNSNR